MRAAERRPGFSLPELLIIVVILGTLAAVGIPRYRAAALTRRETPTTAPLRETGAVRTAAVGPGTYLVTSRPGGARRAAVIAHIRALGCADIRPIANAGGVLTGAVVHCPSAAPAGEES